MSRATAPAYTQAFPQPGQLWIGLAPALWPAASSVWFDPLGRVLRWPAETSADRIPASGLEVSSWGFFHLPPVEARDAGERQRFREALDSTVPVWRHEIVGSISPGGKAEELLIDWTPVVLGTAEPPAETPAGASHWLPLLPRGVGASALELLGEIGRHRPRAVFARAAELSPSDRRRIAARLGEASFEAIHHGAPPDERGFARAVVAAGVAARPPRPSFGGARRDRNRAAAARLAEGSELWLELGRSEAVGQELLAAARRLESLTQDVDALAREGHLALLEWLPAEGARWLREWAIGGGEPSLAALRAEYFGEGPR